MGAHKHISAVTHTVFVFAHSWTPTHQPQHSIFFYIIPNFGLAICAERRSGRKKGPQANVLQSASSLISYAAQLNLTSETHMRTLLHTVGG